MTSVVLPQFEASTLTTSREISATPEVLSLLLAGSPVAMGVSGGKDSTAQVLATCAYLDSIGHRGPRVLIHSDLGRVEWSASLPACEKLANRVGLELIVVRRKAGDLLARWQGRWANNLARYRDLSCVKLILPWSTPSMRFCTSELKTDVICAALKKRFPGQVIVSASGIRRDESTARSNAPIAKPQPKLTSAKHQTRGIDWHPIATWTLADVLLYHDEQAFPLHEAYTLFGSSRVSCVLCIMGSESDLRAALKCQANHPIYRAMVCLEISSSFAFQGKWLGDLAPELLTADMREGVKVAQAAAAIREKAEARIPKHLLYTAGWPTVMPTPSEAGLLSEVRRDVARALALNIGFTDPAEIIGRYAALMAMREARNN